MINVNEVFQYIDFLAAKNQSGGTFTPDQFNLAMKMEIRNFVRKYLGVPEQYQPGNPQPQTPYEITTLLRNYLNNLKPVVKRDVDANGFITLPDDYIYNSSLRWVRPVVKKINPYLQAASAPETCDCDDDGPTIQSGTIKKQETVFERIPIEVLGDAQFDWCAGASDLACPTLDNPKARLEDQNRMFILPLGIPQVELSYVRYPKTPFWAYTTAGGFNTYNPLLSQNIELPEICATEFVLVLLEKLGIKIREGVLVNYADRTRQRGT